MKWQQYLEIYTNILYHIVGLKYKNRKLYKVRLNIIDKYIRIQDTSVDAIALKLLCFKYQVDMPFIEWFEENEDKLIENQLPYELSNLINECLLELL